MKPRKFIYLLVILLFISSLYSIHALSYSPVSADLAEAVPQQTDGAPRISYHAETGKVRFIGTDLAHPIRPPNKLRADATRDEAARSFLATYGPLFGLKNPAQELTVMRESTMDGGRSKVRYQQVYREAGSPAIPVVGGELIVNIDSSRNVLSASGEILPNIQVNTTPRLDATAAQQIALEAMAKEHEVGIESLTATQPALWIYTPILLGAPGPRLTSLVWRMEVQAKGILPVRELVLVEAHLGFVVLHFNQVDTALNRIVCDNQNVPSTDPCKFEPPVCTEGSCPGSGNEYNYAYNYAGDTYNFYLNNHNRDSIDGAGMTLKSTVGYCPSGPCPYVNAFWDGIQMYYGQGFASVDDVVGHEMTHGVTQYESGLFYYMQSGAINESLSDVWGEFIDQTNGKGNDAPEVRWLLGEDLSIPGFSSPIRSMNNPPLRGDPDKMSSSNYFCSTGDWRVDDNGGVHYNSGVNNKAASLMTDGGTFNGKTVTGIGITKVAKIYYEVQTNLLTSASDYQDLYDGLQQACSTLVGTAGITAADCEQVKNAVDATQMNQQPASCAANEAPVCPAGQTASNLFFDNLEDTQSGNWAHGPVSGFIDEWYYPQNSNPYGYDFTYATSGLYNLWGNDVETTADFAIAMAPNVALPVGKPAYMRFNHAYGFEYPDWDGGVLEYSTDGGSSWADAGPLFIDNGYNGAITNISESDNPLKGRPAFVAFSNGYISSRLNLASLAGGNVKFRFRIGADLYVGDWGWFIDDIRIYTCDWAEPPELIYLPLIRKP